MAGWGNIGKRIWLAWAGLCSAGLAGHSPAAGEEPTARAVVHRDLAYGQHSRHRLDVFSPPAPSARAPVLVFFHGGAWVVGDKILISRFARMLAERGVVVACANYRLFPEAEFPDFVEDGALAVRWMKREAARFGGDPRSVYLGGHSAGAHLAALLALDPRYLGEGGRSGIKGLIGLAGPYDFYPSEVRLVKPIFHDHAGDPGIMPIAFAARARVPMLLIHSKADPIVPWRSTQRFAAAVQASGGQAETFYVEHRGHLGVMPHRSLRQERDPVLAQIREFIGAPARSRALQAAR